MPTASALARASDIANSNANMAMDQRDNYPDSISAFAENVRDTIKEENLEHYMNITLSAYYERVSVLFRSAK